jgi:molybdenum cofactor biosynthesis enzyme MoaA
MKLCQLNLTTKCNFSCPECPTGEWHNFVEKPQYIVKNADLFRFLRKLPPDVWEVELTG